VTIEEKNGPGEYVYVEDAQGLLGSALIGMRDLKGALTEIEEAIQLDPTRANTQTALGALKLQQRDIKAAEAARRKGAPVIAFSSRDGGQLRSVADHSIIVPTDRTDRAQEIHLCIEHAICEIIETELTG